MPAPRDRRSRRVILSNPQHRRRASVSVSMPSTRARRRITLAALLIVTLLRPSRRIQAHPTDRGHEPWRMSRAITPLRIPKGRGWHPRIAGRQAW